MSHYLVTQRTTEAKSLLEKARAARGQDGAEAIQLCHQAASHALAAVEADAGVVARTQGRTLASRWSALENGCHAPRTALQMRALLDRLDDLADRTHPHTPGTREAKPADVAGATALAERVVATFAEAVQAAPTRRQSEVEAAPMW